MDNNDKKEIVRGYEIKRAIAFENNRGFALAENPNAVDPFVTWQFTENDDGSRDYYWGHYTKSSETAERDYALRIADYQEYGIPEKDAYKYYAAQHPIDIGTIPKTPPIRMVSFDTREDVEQGRFQAWGYLIYDAPLTERQIADYELRAAPGNLDIVRRMGEQAQDIGKWEEKRKTPGNLRFTEWEPDIGKFVPKTGITPEQMEERHQIAITTRAKRKKPIAEQIKEGAAQAARENAIRPVPGKNTDRSR